MLFLTFFYWSLIYILYCCTKFHIYKKNPTVSFNNRGVSPVTAVKTR